MSSRRSNCRFPTGSDGPRRRSGSPRPHNDQFPQPGRSGLCRLKSESSHPYRREPNDSPIPQGTGREDTSTYHPSIDHVPCGIHEKNREPASCSNLAQRFLSEGGPASRSTAAARDASLECDQPIRSPRMPGQTRWRFSSRGAYMPGEEAVGKGKIYNLSWNIRSGSRASYAAGKMCMKGTSPSG